MKAKKKTAARRAPKKASVASSAPLPPRWVKRLEVRLRAIEVYLQTLDRVVDRIVKVTGIEVDDTIPPVVDEGGDSPAS